MLQDGEAIRIPRSEANPAGAPGVANTALLDRRVYKYGCLPPKAPSTVIEQMFLAHRYRVTLVLIERARRAAVRALLPEDRKLWSETLKKLKPEIAVIHDRAAELRRGAREICGVYWGTYQLVEAADQASRASLMLSEDPRWPPWTGEGAVSVQLIGGMEKTRLATDTQVRLLAGEGDKGDLYQTLCLRIGSRGRAPIWTELPIKTHRPLPEGSVIKRVTVRRRLGGARTSNPKSGRREYWTAEFVIEMPLAPSRAGHDIVGVDLGWRRIGDELRVCAFMDSRGESGELRLSSHMIGGFRRTETLRKTRDDMRNRALSMVLALRATAPEWFRKATERAHAWRNPKRIPVLLGHWSRARWDGDAEAYAWLTYWLERDRHLWQWESDQRRKNLNGKRKFYENFAAHLAERYEMLVLEEFDLRTFARRPAKDALVGPDGRKESQQEEQARGWRHLAGTYDLRLVLENAFLTHGGSACRVPAMDTTRTCGACGLVVRRDFAGSIRWTCDCGVVHDQDVNAGKNLCERFRALEAAGGARIRKAGKSKEEMESRFVRARKKKLGG